MEIIFLKILIYDYNYLKNKIYIKKQKIIMHFFILISIKNKFIYKIHYLIVVLNIYEILHHYSL